MQRLFAPSVLVVAVVCSGRRLLLVVALAGRLVISSALWRGDWLPIPACVIMGMSGYFAAAYHTPLAAMLMVSELTGTYSLLLPTMWVVALAFFLVGEEKSIVTTSRYLA